LAHCWSGTCTHNSSSSAGVKSFLNNFPRQLKKILCIISTNYNKIRYIISTNYITREHNSKPTVFHCATMPPPEGYSKKSHKKLAQ
jgi:hypothetical protein